MRMFHGAALSAAVAAIVAAPLFGSAAQAQTEISLWRHIGDLKPEMDAFASFVSDFNASQSDWKVVWEELPQQSYDDSINAAALSGNLPCVIDVDGPFVPNFAWAGNIIPIDDYIAGIKGEFLPSTIGVYNGKAYAIGQFEASLAVWGRKSVLEKHNIRIPTVESPWTKDEFDAALKTLKDSGEFETAIDMFTFYTHEWLPYAYSPFLQSFGGDLIDRSTYLTAEGAINGPEAVAWGEWWQNLFQSGLSDPKATDDQAFIQGRAALAWIGNWYYPTLAKAWGDDLVYLPPPDMGHGPKVGAGSWQWAVTKSCPNPDGAWAFIDFIMSADNIAEMSNITGLIPSRSTALPMADLYKEGGPLAGIVAFPANFAVVRPPTPAYGFIRGKFQDVSQAIANGADVQDTLDDAAAAIDADIEANNGYGFK